MSFLSRIFPRAIDRRKLLPLYEAIVAEARDPAWFRDGGVPDTVDGRFDMVTALMALVLLRLETDERTRHASVQLTELFIDDMDGSLRQMGIGDLMVGKHVGGMMGALGGRLTAFRGVTGNALAEPARRNIFHDRPPSDAQLGLVAQRLERVRAGLETLGTDQILKGRIA